MQVFDDTSSVEIYMEWDSFDSVGVTYNDEPDLDSPINIDTGTKAIIITGNASGESITYTFT